jgi:hypothetical protein
MGSNPQAWGLVTGVDTISRFGQPAARAVVRAGG